MKPTAKIGRKICSLSLVALVLVAITIHVPTEAHAPGVVLSGRGTATIDGMLSPGEWDNAARIDFDANLPLSDGGGTTPATLFVMNDGTNLYLGVKIVRSKLNTGTIGFGFDTVSFEFDNNHSGFGGPEEGDDILVLNPGLTFLPPPFQPFLDEVRTSRGGCPSGLLCGFLDSQVGGTSDGEGAASNNGSFSFFEISHPLNSADDLNDFSLAPGMVVGFSLSINLSSLTAFCSSDCLGSTFFPLVAGNGDIVIASPVIAVAIDIKPGGFPNSINPETQGTIPVAVLSSSTFDAPTSVDRASLTFGRTGNELSLAFCSNGPADVNGDSFLDLVCHFNTLQTGFQSGDTAGVLKGKTLGGVPIIGTDSVRIVP